MKRLVNAERYLLTTHILSMVFGLAGILLVLPNPNFLAFLSSFGELGHKALSWSMTNGGVVYMLLGMLAVALYAYRTLGIWHWLSFMIPAIGISLSSELLGTSTGFPFGHYHYLDGLGYKIAGLVPFTIPLSWFYLGFSAYIIARAGLDNLNIRGWLRSAIAIFFGALLLTSWDFVLDPAMSQTSVPFWFWEQPGAFFGMPYQNFAGWMGTGIVYMTIASLLWKFKPLVLDRNQLQLPLIMYLSNFSFATILSLAAGMYIPVVLGIISGVAPALVLYRMAITNQNSDLLPDTIDSQATKLTVVPASASSLK